MDRVIKIKVEGIELEAVLNGTATADAVWEVLPVNVQSSMWGDELYFALPEELGVGLEKGQELVEIGDLGYWPVGNAFCIFFGPTPMSQGDEIRPASPVTVFGRVVGDAAGLDELRSGAQVVVEKKT
jgi:hypothetical protein